MDSHHQPIIGEDAPGVVGAELRRWRTKRGLSLAGLARQVHYSKGYLSKIETGDKRITLEVARSCDVVLDTGGALTALLVDREKPPDEKPEPATEPDHTTEICPYLGLAAFGPEDARWFFGRAQVTADLVDQLDERITSRRPLVMAAPSGAGKSSLLAAGLVPALARGALPGSQRWPVVIVTPGVHPLTALAARVGDLTEVDPVEVAGDPAGFAALLTSATSGKPGETPSSARILLIVDQFEETFTECQDEAERQAFITTLCAAAQHPAGLVVLGVRADFYGRCLDYPLLLAAMNEDPLELGPMTPAQLREVITGPATVEDLHLEPGLVELLLADLGAVEESPDTPSYDPGALPLLAQALRATWQQRTGRLLSVAGYRCTGGIRQAIATIAERAYTRLDPAEQQLAQQILLRLVNVGAPGRDTRRRVPRARLLQALPAPAAAVERVLKSFGRARLVTFTADSVEITHEALLLVWPRLGQWISADRAGLRTHQQLSEAADAWEATGRDASGLLRGSRLAIARDWAAGPGQRAGLSALEVAYLDCSIDQEQRERQAEYQFAQATDVLQAAADAEGTEENKQLNQAATYLAGAVHRQWTQEASLRSLRRPEPIRIRWSTTGRPVAASLTAVLNEGVVPGRPVRLHHDMDHVVELFRKLRARQLVILGDPGAGKTVLALLFTLGLLDSLQPGEPVPALLTASSWNPRTEHLHTWLARRILEEYPALANHDVYGHDAAARLVTLGRVMVVLDGLDEIPEALQPEAIDALETAVAGMHPLVVTCRSTDYEAAIARSGTILTRAAVLEIEPIELDDAATFLMATGPSAECRWRPVVDQLRARPNLPLARALTSPLMISLARTVYASPTSDPAQLLNASQFRDYAAVERHLLEAFIPAAYHDPPAAPGTPSTSASGRYPPDQAHQWLTFLARHLAKLATRDLAWWQLVDTIPRVTRGISVGLTAGLTFGFAGGLGEAGDTDITYRLVAGLAFGLVFGLATGLSYGLSKRPKPLRVETRFQGTLAPFLHRLMPGLATGVGVGFGVGIPYGGALVTGLTFGFAFAAPVWLGIPTDVAQVSSPGVVLKQDRTAALSFGLVLALPFGLAGGLVVGLPTGLAFGVVGGVAAVLAGAFMGAVAGGILGGRAYGRVGGCMFALSGSVVGSLVFAPIDTGSYPVLGLAYGATFGLAVGCVGVLSRAWGAYALSRIWLALRGDLPWRLMRFLDDAHRRGVLRQSGAMYQFRHARVQDHLAHKAASNPGRALQ
ncbi:MAG: hypothetical protein DLM62_01390 [Pseudonocardiales bacterium]|nr:MAG: hypothetical protein DLM62_01390 [Pseudonocardiales bacterium]